MQNLDKTEQLLLQIVLGRLTLARIQHRDQYTRITFAELYNSVVRGLERYFLNVEALCEELNARIDAIEEGGESKNFWAYDQVGETEWELIQCSPGYFKQADHCITFMAPSREEAEIVVQNKIIPFLTAS